MTYYYSTKTGEHIKNPSVVRDWMGETNVKPPEVSDTQSAFFENGSWIIKNQEEDIEA